MEWQISEEERKLKVLSDCKRSGGSKKEAETEYGRQSKEE